MGVQARPSLKLGRFELGVSLTATTFVAVGGVILSGWLAAQSGPGCSAGLITCGSDEGLQSTSGTLGAAYMSTMAILPYALGAMLGVPIVSTEIERGTAPLAWSLSPGRLRWLAWRCGPSILLLLLAATALALISDRVEVARFPLLDPRASFLDYGLRGPLVVARAVVAFAVGLATGAAIGRVLPSLIVTGAICLAVAVAMGVVMPLWIPVRELSGGAFDCASTCIAFSDVIRTPDGRFISYSDAATIGGLAPGGDGGDQPGAPVTTGGFSEVTVGITGDHMPEIEARESATLLFIAASALGLATIVVRRKRPC